MSRARDLSRLSNQTNFTTDVATGRVGLGSEIPTAKLNVTGIVSATAFYGDGSNLEGVASAGLGTALADDGAGSVIYYTDKILGVAANTTVDVPDTSDSNVAYTQYAEVSVDSGIDLIIADGDDFVPDILGISSDVQVPGVLTGSGGRVRADNFSNKAGTGAPNFPSGLTGTTGSFTGNVSVGGVLTYEDVTNIDSVGIVTARTGVRITDGGLIVTAGVSTFAADVSIADKIIHTGDTDTAIRFPTNNTFTVETAGSERLRITSAGLIGIGAITPSVSYGNGLHIAGGNAGLKLQNTNNGDWAYIEYADESNTTKFIQGYRDQSGLYAIRPGTSLNATPGISLTSAGKVGINITDNTTADLQVRTGTNANGILRMGGNSGSAIGLDITYSNSSFTSTIFKQNYRSTSAGALMEFDSGYFVFKTGTAGAEKLRITSDGKVGIGTNAPNHPLHIHSSGTSYAQFTDEATGIGATDGVIIGIDHPHTYVWNYEDGDFVVAAGAAEKFRVGYGGTTIQNQRYSTYTNNSSVAGGQTRTLTITALRYGTACIHFGGTDGNGQYVHFKINLGGQMWGSGNGYNAEVSSSGYVGGSYSVTKNNTSYVIQVTAGSNIMYYSYTFESTSYSASGYAAIAET